MNIEEKATKINAYQWLSDNYGKRLKRIKDFKPSNESQQIKQALLSISVGLHQQWMDQQIELLQAQPTKSS